MNPEQSGVKMWQWVVTVLVIVALIVLGYYMFKGDAVPVGPDGEKIDNGLVAGGDVNRVVVTDQFPGNIVYLSSVQFTKPGFVAIHKDNSGQPGEVIGSQYFDKGINPGRITLTTSTVESGVYYAVMYTDDGDRIFDASKDMPIKDSAGNIIMKIFRATSSVTEIKA